MSVDASSGNMREIPASGWRATFASLTVPEYKLYFWGMVAFFFGMNMMVVLRGYLVYQITGSEVALAMIMLSVALPMLIMAPVGGVITDRVDRRSLLMWAQASVCVLNLINTILISAGVVQFWHLLILSALSGTAFSFVMPARQAIIPNLVPRRLLMNGMSLSSSAMNGTRIIAPAVGGLLIKPIGVGGGFAVLTTMYAISVLFTIGLPRIPPAAREASSAFLRDFTEGFGYIRRDRLVLGLLLLATVPMIFAMPYQTLMPVFASKVFHVGAGGLGVLQAMSGAGGLVGALITANLDRSPRKGMVMIGAAIGTGAFLMLFSYAPFGVALPMLAMVGLMSMVFTTVNTTMITSIVPDSMRGRVMSVAMMTFGLMPLGAVPASFAAEAVGVSAVTAVGGILLVTAVFATYLAFPQFRTLDTAVRRQRAEREAAWEAEAAIAGGG